MVAATLPKKSGPVVIFRDAMLFEALEILQESTDPNSPMKVRGIFQKSETKNGNGRIYPRQLWEKIVNDPSMQQRIKERSMLGEIEHPTDGMTNLRRVSHVITAMEMKGDEIIGAAEIFPTEAGKDLMALFRAKAKVGISSRGKGTSFMRGNTEVVNDDYVLETFDFVYNPSTPGAFPRLVSESRSGVSKEEQTMADVAQLKRIDGRMGEVLKLMEKSSPSELSGFDNELIESEVTIGRLVNEDASLASYGSEVLGKVKGLREKVRAKMTGSLTENAVPLDVYKKALAEAEDAKRQLAEAKNPKKGKGGKPVKEAEEPLRVDPTMPSGSSGEEEEEEEAGEMAYESAFVCTQCHAPSRILSRTAQESIATDEACGRCGGALELEMAFRRSGNEDRNCPNCQTGMELQTETGDHFCPKCGFKEKQLEHLSRGELVKRHLASVKVVEQLASKCRGLIKSNKTLSSRYEAAVKLVGEAAQKNERVALLSRVREVVGRNPILKKIESRLLTCRSVRQVDAMVNEMLPILRDPPKVAPKKESKDPLPPKGAGSAAAPKPIGENKEIKFPTTPEERENYLTESVLRRNGMM